MTRISGKVSLPDDLIAGQVSVADFVDENRHSIIHISNEYQQRLVADVGASEILAMQRLMTLAQHATSIRVIWDKEVSDRALRSPSIFPLLAILLLCTNAKHEHSTSGQPIDPAAARTEIFKYRAKFDLFAESQILICADEFGQGRPFDLYEPKSRRLRSKQDFETMAANILASLLPANTPAPAAYQYNTALGVVMAELFENTHIHARFDEEGRPLTKNNVRGIVFKRIHVPRAPARPHEKPAPTTIDCLEVSILDCGIGYYASFTKNRLNTDTNLDEEWQVLHNCLQRHYHPEIPDKRAAHQAMGLYEVLRAVELVSGQFEVRTGRLHAYRTFLPGELRPQMESLDAKNPGRPKPRLLDVNRRYLAKPVKHEALVGTSVRIIIPLA